MERAAPSMAGRSDEEHSFSNSNSNSFKTIDSAFSQFIGDDDSEDSGSEFVFQIEPNLLIDSRCLKIGEVIGEGSCSIVFEGLYVSLSFSHCLMILLSC